MPRRRPAVLGVGITDIQEASELQVVRKFERTLDVGGVEAAGPEGRKSEVGCLHHHRGSDDARIHHAAVEAIVVLFGGVAVGLVVADHEHHGCIVGHAGNAADLFERLGRLDDLHGHGLSVDGRRGKAARLEYLGEFFGFYRLGGKGTAAIAILGKFDKRHRDLFFLRKYT